MFLFNRHAKSSFFACSFLLFLLALPFYSVAEPVTYAEEVIKTEPPAEHPNWSISLGGGAIVRPEFEGSDKYNVRFMPILRAEYMQRVFLSTTDGLGVYIFREPLWNVGAVDKYNPGREQKDSEILKGMGDIDPGAELGIFASWTPAPFFVRIEALQGTGDVRGLQATATAGHTFMPLEKLQWTNSVGTTFTDSRYNETFFGVDKTQSRRSGHDYYDADAGFKSVQFNSRANYQLTDNITALVFGQYKRLTGPAADSPLVEEGSKNQGMLGVGLTYTF